MKTTRTRSGILALAAAPLVLAACQSGSAAPDSEEAGPDTITVVASADHNVTMMGPMAATYLDMWDSCVPGVTVETSITERVPEALASGAADIGVTSPNGFISAVDQGLDVTLVGAAMDAWVQFPVVPADSDVEVFEDLKGATFGVSRFGSAGHFATAAAAEAAGWTEDDYSVQPMGSLSSMQAALANGAIEAFLWSGTGSFTMEADGIARTLESVSELVGPNSMTIWGANNDLIENHPQVAHDVLDCMFTAVDELRNDEEKALAMLEEWGFAPEVAQRVVESEMQSVSTDGAVTDEMLQGMIDATKATTDGEQDHLTLEDVQDMWLPWTELGQ